MTAPLTDRQVVVLARAGVLLATRAARLSTFEIETIAEVAERLQLYGRTRAVTAAEWQIVEGAVQAMGMAPIPQRRAA